MRTIAITATLAVLLGALAASAFADDHRHDRGGPAWRGRDHAGDRHGSRYAHDGRGDRHTRGRVQRWPGSSRRSYRYPTHGGRYYGYGSRYRCVPQYRRGVFWGGSRCYGYVVPRRGVYVRAPFVRVGIGW